MSTQDDLRRVGKAAVALAGVAVAGAKQVAEQLGGPTDLAKAEAKRRVEGFVDDGRRTAADIVGALRRQSAMLFDELGYLERDLRAADEDEDGDAGRSSGEPLGINSPPGGAEPSGRRRVVGREEVENVTAPKKASRPRKVAKEGTAASTAMKAPTKRPSNRPSSKPSRGRP